MSSANPYGFPPVLRQGEGPARIDEHAVRWAGSSSADAPVVLLLHGLGSHEEDLLGLAPALPPGLRYASLRGVFTSGPGFAWLQPPPLEGTGTELLEESAAAVEAWIAAVVPGGRVAGAIGFSQGAMLALHLLRRDPAAMDWLAQLSGAPFPAPQPGDAALADRGLPVLWGHGGQDPLFDPEQERAVREWMDRHTACREVRSETLGHGIDETVLAELARFVREQS